ncbi:MAG: glutamine-hydrolyzing GMP synthase [Ignavibacteria bacterium]|nr:glutamine-hydrolyzing GMP synthase [Bacteroidota bacterium]MSQ45912.1 glutamine-hydrolyzing GMP synthase [Ignavibacteria bacterium]
MMKQDEILLILDFGSQVTQLIARKIRELNVYCEIHPFNISIEKIKQINPKAIIFSGGPQSVYGENAPISDSRIYDLNIPLLGICYGLQLIAHQLGGKVENSSKREFGRAILNLNNSSSLFSGFNSSTEVWMSHGDSLTSLPTGFNSIANTTNTSIGAIEQKEKNIYGVQFHPEVHHTKEGKKIFENFLFKISKFNGTWSSSSFITSSINEIKERVGNENVICALSGGVDSSVTAILLERAIGKQLHCIHIDNGLMRSNESKYVVETFQNKFNLQLHFVDASKLFLSKLANVEDPELKRKIIGNTFIEVFEGEAKKIPNTKYLAQGTLYPDVIESVSNMGPSATIKTHHNVGGLPEKMNLKLIEPLRELFKDEVREVGKLLGVPNELLNRHPFPGPGLAIRVLGSITENRLNILRKADSIYIEELQKNNLYDLIWQAFAVLLPINSVGVMGDERTYENVLALRAVTSTDGMTADWFNMPNEVLGIISNRIINEVRGINRVVYDVSSKPPATIEWE